MKRLLPLLALIICSSTVSAQQVRPADATQIYHELNQLKHLTNVLYFAAHPDDENTRMLAWLVNDQHIPTAYLSLTRGDGGQNILGPHLGPSLGLIRTHELLEARKLDGAGQFFTRAVDFGYSKTAEETFRHWDEDQLTHDAVWVIRNFKPDVIICRFPPDERAGHGQHAASAIIAHKAFNAAGDNKTYPEQLKRVNAWQPKRILFNAYRFGSRNTTNEEQYKEDVGQYNSLLGMGYGELAGISRSIHRSQGAGTRSVPGVQTEYFDLVDGDPLDKSLFDGIDISWGRVGRKDISKEIDNIIASYEFTHPEKSLPALLDLYKKVKEVKGNPWKQQKINELKQLILHTSGFMAEMYTDKAEVIQREEVAFDVNVITRAGATPVKLLNFKCLGKDTSCNVTMPEDQLVSFSKQVTIPIDAAYTEPYWLTGAQPDPAHYPIPKQEYIGLPKTPNKLIATAQIIIGDETFDVDIPLSYKTLDATHGDVVEQLRVVPDVVLNFNSAFYLADTNGFTTKVHIHTYKDINNGVLSVYNGEVSQEVNNINLTAGSDTTINVVFKGTYAVAVAYGNKDLFAALQFENGTVFDKQQITIKYEHLPTLQFYSAAHTKVLRKDWKTTAKKIGYIEGAGDDVSEILRFAGLQVEILKKGDITPENLKQYDAILVGIRALNTVDDIPVWMPSLLNYTKEGGTLVMQYNTAHRLKTEDFAPYPLKLSRNRVTEEDAEIKILAPQHILLNHPNKITQADFENWVQERGLYFAEEWDNQYTPLFSMHDSGEEPLEGSTLYAQYGKGHYIYTPLSFFRQLPAGNTGAIKLLCNFLSVGK